MYGKKTLLKKLMKLSSCIQCHILGLMFFTFSTMGYADNLSSAELLKDAISKRKTGHYSEAINILEKLQLQHTSHKRINIELAINHIKLKQFSEAEAILLHLQGMPLSEQESKKLSKLQQLIDKKEKFKTSRSKFSGDISLYYGVDNFISLYPDWSGSGAIYCYDYFDGEDYLFTECYDEDNSEVDDIYLDEQQDRENITEKTKETYTSQRLRLNYQYYPKNKVSIFGQATKLIWYNDLNLLQKKISDSARNKYGQARFDSSLYLFFPNRWIFDVRYRGIYHFSDNDKFLDEQSLLLSLAIPVGKSRVKAAIERKEKSYGKQQRDKDAAILIPSIEYSYQLSEAYKLALGGRYYRYRADDDIFSYNNGNLYLSLHYYPFDNFSAFASINFHQLNYEIDDPDLVNWGRETKRSIAVGVKYQFTEALSFGLNGHYVNKKLDMSYGHEDWNRVEAFVSYRF